MIRMISVALVLALASSAQAIPHALIQNRTA
jgi:hypothetical protein